ncbi:MAG TPA: GTPase domain-containing protein [Thermomicrobiales bacterium]|jgi:hypothetical protein
MQENDHEPLVAAATSLVHERSAGLSAGAQLKLQQIRGIERACENLVNRKAELSTAAGEMTTAEMVALAEKIAAVKEELRQESTLYRWLGRRGLSQTLWVVLGGKVGAGKSVLAGAITGVPDVVPSRSGRSVSGVSVRIVHDATAAGRRGTIHLRDGTHQTAEGEEIDEWIALRDSQRQELRRYLDVDDAEIRVAYLNHLAKLFTLIDTAGLIEGRDDDERRLDHAIFHQADLLLIVDRPEDYREEVTPINQVVYDYMATVPAFIILNRTPGNGENCRLRREELESRGIPADRILMANCADTREVNEHVLVPIFEWLLATNQERIAA